MGDIDKKYNELYDKLSPVIYKESPNSSYYNPFKKYEILGGEDTSLKFGDWFLYETEDHVEGHKIETRVLNYPKLAIFSKYIPCDQTVELEFIEYPKSWHDRLYSKYNFLTYYPAQIKSHIEWDDAMWIYGKWDSKPNWKQMKKAFRKTQWYHRDKHELRDIRLKELLGN